MELCIKQKSIKQTRICFIFFKVALFCFDEGFALSWRSLNQIHEVVTWNGFHEVVTWNGFHEVVTWNGFQLAGVPRQELLLRTLNEQEENCLGQETQGLDIRPVETVLWSKFEIFCSNRCVFGLWSL